MDEDRILKMLRRLNRAEGAIHSLMLAVYLEISDRNARYWLKKLEAAGKVDRPFGRCSGWVVR